MTIETFNPPIAPSPSTSDKPEFKILEAEFGDGYTQSTPDGIHNVRRVVSLSWDLLNPTQAKAIQDFILAKKGVERFYYKLTRDAAPTKWTCKEFERKTIAGGYESISLTLRQAFDIG